VALAFSRRHRIAITGDSDGILMTWDAVQGQYKQYLSDLDPTCNDHSNSDRAVEKVYNRSQNNLIDYHP
jgi:hypothetical protein